MAAQVESLSARSCKICFESYNEKANKPELMVPCGHTICKDCVRKLVAKECPTCKKQFTSTATVWDLIPAVAADEVDSNISQELAGLKKLLDYVEELIINENEINMKKIEDAERMVNLKAEETINRVIDEQNALLHRLKTAKNILENRRSLNMNTKNSVKYRYDHIRMQTKYANKLSVLKSNKEDLSGEIAIEFAKLKALKENIDAFFKRNDVFFVAKVHVDSEQLLGEVKTSFSNDKLGMLDDSSSDSVRRHSGTDIPANISNAGDHKTRSINHQQQQTDSIQLETEHQSPEPVLLNDRGPLTIEMLTAAKPQKQKQMLGERLYPLVESMEPDLAGNITGMLLEMNNVELLVMLNSRDFLTVKVKEAVDALHAHWMKQISLKN